MRLAAELLVALVALLHVSILVLEMFLWDKPYGRRVFRLTPEDAAATKVLAANQGLYNGFLAAGLFWGLWLASMPVQVFFLLCVFAAGVFGGFSATREVLGGEGSPGGV